MGYESLSIGINDAVAASFAVLSVAMFICLPIAAWGWLVYPLWRSGGLHGWITRGGGGRMHSTETGARRTPRPALVTFRDIHYSVKLSGQGRPELHILKSVSGVLLPGTLTAIMGPSGCGKSTLLDILADTKRVGVVEGDVRLNGEARGTDFRSTCAYVMQEDCCHSTLTVHETLWFVCALRLGPDVGRQERLELITRTMVDLDLAHVADTRIGDDVSGGLSGGQRRRVTIAIEILSGPALVLLDEPTSGLDAYGAQQVVAALRRFADRGRTLACTIHQPRAETFRLFHQLLLVKAGETMYCGPVAQVPDFLRGCGVACPPSVNLADVVVDLTHTKEADADEDGGEAVDLVARFAESDLRREIEAEIDSVEIGRHPALADLAAQSLKAPQEEEGRGGCCGGGGGGYPNPLLHQVGVLVRRQWTLDLRDFGYKFTWVLNGFVLALNASTYLLVAQPPLDAQPASVYRDDMGCSASLGSGDGVQGCVCHLDMADSADGGYTVADDVAECGQALVARTNVDFAHRGFLFLVVNALFINEAVFVPTIIADKRFFAREHGARAYSVLAWHLAWLVKLGLTAALKALFYTPCFYFIGQLRPAWSAYLAAALVTGGMGLAGSAVAMLLTTLVPGLGAATTAFGCAVLLYQNVCGFFLPIAAIPPYLTWLTWTSVFTYGYYAIVTSQQMFGSIELPGDTPART